MTRILNSSYAQTYKYVSLSLGIWGLIVATLSLILSYYPIGRITLGSPATSFWAGLIMIYQSSLAYLGLLRLFEGSVPGFFDNYSGIFRYSLLVYMLCAFTLFQSVAALCLMVNIVPDFFGGAWFFINALLLGFNSIIGLETSVLAASRGKASNIVDVEMTKIKKSNELLLIEIPPYPTSENLKIT